MELGRWSSLLAAALHFSNFGRYFLALLNASRKEFLEKLGAD